MQVVTPKGMERERITLGVFQRFVTDSLRDLGAAPGGGDFARHLDKQPQGLMSLLAELRKSPEVVSVLQGMRLPAPPRAGMFDKEKPQYLLSSTTLMLLRGKALNLSVYTLYDGAADADWIRLTTARWIEDLQRLNAR